MVAQTLKFVSGLVTRIDESQMAVAQTSEVVSGLVVRMEESQTTVARTLEVVSGLDSRTKELIDGVYRLFIWRACYLTSFVLDLNNSRGQTQGVSV